MASSQSVVCVPVKGSRVAGESDRFLTRYVSYRGEMLNSIFNHSATWHQVEMPQSCRVWNNPKGSEIHSKTLGSTRLVVGGMSTEGNTHVTGQDILDGFSFLSGPNKKEDWGYESQLTVIHSDLTANIESSSGTDPYLKRITMQFPAIRTATARRKGTQGIASLTFEGRLVEYLQDKDDKYCLMAFNGKVLGQSADE